MSEPGATPPADWSTRAFRKDDYDAARALWARCEGLGHGDSAEEVHRFLERNPGTSFVAASGADLAGTILCGHDGRRGFIYRLGVAPERRRQGIARALLERSLAALEAEQIPRCQVFVRADNATGIDFWRRAGGRLRSDLCVFSIAVGGEARQEPAVTTCPSTSSAPPV